MVLIQTVAHQNISADAGNLHHVLNLPELGGLVVGGVAGGHDLDAAAHCVGGGLGDIQFLLLGEVEHLAGLAHGEDTGAALFNIPVAQKLDGLKINGLIVVIRGNHHRPDAGSYGKSHNNFFSLKI
ncbi:hypothetical protein SDC9_147533 [bioreactor metagenome]|uniref:Uncharacterized protein n=1 Tax=bioreactor metagenome TaxID=1076179 RepID=A0A645EGR8_9ZZZZ